VQLKLYAIIKNMSKILVVDGEDKAREEISKALLSLNPQNKLEVFANFEDLELHFNNLNEEEQKEYFNFNLVILDYMLVLPAAWEVKLNDLKKRNSVEASFCFTSYDNVKISRKHIRQLHMRNIFYKPFDPLILKESLNMALQYKSRVSPVEMRAQVTESHVAILKEIELVSICELGFVTMNESSIDRLKYSKFISELFLNNKKQSVWAQCIMSLEVPNKPGYFINKFQFIGIESGALMHLRRYLKENQSKRVANAVWNLQNNDNAKVISMAIINTKEDNLNNLKSEIESRFKNTKVDYITIDSNTKNEAAVLTYDCVINLNPELEYDFFKNRFSADTKIFLLSDILLNDEKLQKYLPFYADIFNYPMDRSYFFKKLKIFMQELEYKEPPDMMNITTTEKLKALTMVKISEICELYLNFTYYRELPIETSREFAFIGEDESQIVELPGFCNFAEKAQQKEDGKEVFTHQFIFWGMTDHYLKQIRIWLLSNYIQKKQ
jgi:hypothetical protein